MAQIEIDLTAMPLWEAGAVVISHVAFPLPARAAQRDRYFDGLCGKHIRTHADGDGGWARAPQWIKPAHALLTPQQLKSATKTGDARMSERLLAGAMALPLMCEEIFGEPAELRAGVKRLSVASIAEHFKPVSAESDAENLLKRTWRPTLPVLHIASAAVVYERWAEAELGRIGRATDIMNDTRALLFVLEKAEEHEAFTIARFGGKRDNLVRFRLAKQGQKSPQILTLDGLTQP